MAERRMLAKTISVSERVNDLPDIFDMLLFTWMIPHVDDWGRMNGSPAKIKGVVIPMLEEKGKADVRDSLERLAEAGLISWYKVGDEEVVQIEQFEKHQQGLHKRTKSKFPDPPKLSDSIGPSDIPGNSGNFPKVPPELNRTELKGTEQNGKEGKGTELPATPDEPAPADPTDDEWSRIEKLINDCELKDMTLYAQDQIKSFVGVVETGVIEAAVKKASGKHVNYALRTLEGWAAEGKTRTADVMPPPSVGERRQTPRSSGRTGKPELPIVQNAPAEATVSDDEFAEYIRMAEEMKASKGASARA